MGCHSRFVLALLLCLIPVGARAQEIQQVPGTTTRDVAFQTHDGYPMVGRLTLPDTPGAHPVMMLVQTAEAATKDGEFRNAKGTRVRVYHQYREMLAPLGIGFFSYEGRGVTSNAGGGPVIDRAIYNTSTLANKVQDGIAALHTLAAQPGVDGSRIVLRGISEGTMLAAEIAAAVPREVGGLVLSGVLGNTLKEALVFMASDGAYMSHLGNWDVNGDGRITAPEFEADAKGINKQLPAGITFSSFDANGDGFYTKDELLAGAKPLTDAIRQEQFETFVPWLTASAAVQVPGTVAEWVKDSFRQPTMWETLSQLAMPIGVFQGEDDRNTPAAGVRELERKAKAADKSNMEFRYFAGLDHGLGTAAYFNTGMPSAGYAAIFEYMKRWAR